jgi:hypothetical protein
MQVTYNPEKPARFWLALGAVLAVITLCWLGLKYFDKTLAAARLHVSVDSNIIAKIGEVSDTTMYKVRYVDGIQGDQSCYAEYFLYASGVKGRVNVKVTACGSKERPVFSVAER